MLTIQTLVVGSLQTNCYLISDPISHETLVIDPADASEYISDVLSRESLTPTGLVATHGHFDHILGAFGLQVTYNIPFYLHGDDTFLIDRMQSSARHFLKRKNIDPAPTVTRRLEEGDTLAVGKEKIRVLHTPGHTPGSIVILVVSASAMLVGDALFADGSVGRTDTSYGNRQTLEHSIKKIINEKRATVLYPGHGESISVDRAKVMFGV